MTAPEPAVQSLAEKVASDDSALTDAAAELWALLHNGRRPEGYWDGESQRYYRHVVSLFIDSPATRNLFLAAGLAVVVLPGPTEEHDGSGPPVCEPCTADCPACVVERQDGGPR
jgi:hypothetical protein